MHHQRHRAVGQHRVEPGVQVAAVVSEAVGAAGGGVGLSHAHQVGSQAAGQGRHVRDDVAPQVGRRGVAVQENHGAAGRGGRAAGVNVGHLDSANVGAVAGVGVLEGDFVRC